MMIQHFVIFLLVQRLIHAVASEHITRNTADWMDILMDVIGKTRHHDELVKLKTHKAYHQQGKWDFHVDIFIQFHRINVGQQKLQMHAQAQCFCHRGLEQKQNLLPTASSLTCVDLQMRHGKMQSCCNEALNREGTLYWQQYKRNA